jgi:hypothetical protein
MCLKFAPALVCLLLFPSLAAAQYEDPSPDDEDSQPTTDEKPHGLEFSLGLGYGAPYGRFYKSSQDDTTMSDGISGYIPFSFGVGYRVSPLFSFGTVFQYGFLSLKDCGTYSCSGIDTHIGLKARLHLLADQVFSPWFSGGFGYEWFSLDMLRDGASSSGTLKGLDFDFEIGVDFRVTPLFTLGPFFGLQVGNYSSQSSSGTSNDLSDANQATHGWLTFGLRGVFTL